MSRRYLTAKETDKVVRDYPDALTSDLARSMGLTVTQIYNVAHRLGLKKSPAFYESDKSTRIRRGKQCPAMIATRFAKGQKPWNKGTNFDSGGRSIETRFKKGCRPHTWKPIGSERINADGYLDRKISDTGYPPRDWQGVHRIVWVETHGQIPKGSIVVFKNPTLRTTVAEDITLDKLECITRVENMQRNSYHRYPKPIAQLIQLRGALNRKINKRDRDREEQNRGLEEPPVRGA